MKNITRLVLLLLLANLMINCGTSGVVKLRPSATAGYIPNRVNPTDPKGSFGTSYFDVTKRVGVSSIFEDNKYAARYLAEEQPDAGLAIIKDLTAKAAVTTGTDLSVTAELTNKITTTLEKLTDKSHSLNMMRTALYRLNEAAYNGMISQDMYKEMYMDLVEKAAALQGTEFTYTCEKEILEEKQPEVIEEERIVTDSSEGESTPESNEQEVTPESEND